MKTFRRLRYAPRGAQISQNSHCISPWPKSRKKIREITFGPGQSHLHCSLFLSTSLHHGRQPNERERISACAQHIILRGALRPWSPSWRSCPTDDVSSTVHTQHRRHMRQRLAPRTLPNAASPDLRDPRFTKPCWRCPRRERSTLRFQCICSAMAHARDAYTQNSRVLYPVHSRRPPSRRHL